MAKKIPVKVPIEYKTVDPSRASEKDVVVQCCACKCNYILSPDKWDELVKSSNVPTGDDAVPCCDNAYCEAMIVNDKVSECEDPKTAETQTEIDKALGK